MATSTTLSVWRSSGGDQTKTAYAGQMMMVSSFYAATTGTTSANLQKSSTDTSKIILPQNAIVLAAFVNITNAGGSSPLFSIGFTGNTTGTASPTGIINGATAATAKYAFNWAVATSAAMGSVLSSSELVYLTIVGSGTTAGNNTVSGYIQYIVSDNGNYTA